MQESRSFVGTGLAPAGVDSGLPAALTTCVTMSHLDDHSEGCSDDEQRLLSVARTSMNGTSADAGGDVLAQLIVEALQIVSNNYGIDHEDVRMTKHLRREPSGYSPC